jgi:hypothetical protein
MKVFIVKSLTSRSSQLVRGAPGMRDIIWVRALNYDLCWMPRPGEARPTSQKTEASTATHGLRIASPDALANLGKFNKLICVLFSH